MVPDETSLALVGSIQCRSLWVRNYSGGGCNSLSLYSTNVEQIVAGHEFHNSGIAMNHGHYDTGTCVWFNEFRDCRVSGGEGMESIALIYFDPKKPPERLPYPTLAGCEWRDNQLEDTVFLYGGNPWGDARWIEFHSQGAIMVHSSRRGLVLDGDFQYAHLLTGNTIRPGRRRLRDLRGRRHQQRLCRGQPHRGLRHAGQPLREGSLCGKQLTLPGFAADIPFSPASWRRL